MLKRENLRKNFLRVKQMADQNLGRAEKTEVLTENLNTIDRRVEIIKNVSTATGKKLNACMQASGTDMEKRLKKIPITALSCSMLESAGMLGENLIGQMYQMCGELEAGLGKEILQHELEVEETVLSPLTEVVEVDIPNIMKTRKTLNKLVLDMDSAKNRYQTAVRQSQAPNSTAGARADTIKDEYEDAAMKVEQCRDLLVTEMFTFLSKETDYAKCLLELVKAQARYHQRSLQMLEKVIPELEMQLETYPHKPLYACPIEIHLNLTEREIACVIEECVCALLETGLDEEGLFRVAGSTSKVKKLKAAFDAGVAELDDFIKDPHVIAGALKLYLRELPEPLMTYALYQDWMHAAMKSPDDRLQALWIVVNKLPKQNYNNLRYLVKFLAKLAEKADINKMSSSNIAIVMGPNLIWSPADGGPNVLTTGTQSAIVESFITHCDWFFHGDIEFNLSSPMLPGNSNMFPAEMTQSMTSAYATAVTSGHAPVVRSPSDNVTSQGASAMVAQYDSGDGKTSPKVQRRLTKKPAPAPPLHPAERSATMPRAVLGNEILGADMTLSICSSNRAHSIPIVTSSEQDTDSSTPTPSTPDKCDSPLLSHTSDAVERRSPTTPAKLDRNSIPANAPNKQADRSSKERTSPDKAYAPLPPKPIPERKTPGRPTRPGPPPPPPPGDTPPDAPQTPPVEQTRL